MRSPFLASPALALALITGALSCQPALESSCAIGAPDSCGDRAACVGEGVVGHCVRAYETERELWADARKNLGKTVLVRSITLAPASRIKCTSKACLQSPAPTGCEPCNSCSVALQPRNSDFRFMRSANGRELECSGNDCRMECPSYLAGRYELVAQVEPAHGDSFGLSHVRLTRTWGLRRSAVEF